MTQRDKHGEGPLHGVSGKKQARFNPKHIKTFQSSPSPLNISCSLQTFLWSQRPQLGTSLEERGFFSVHVFSQQPFSLHNKSFYLMCSSEPGRECEIWSWAIRNTPRTLGLLFSYFLWVSHYHFYDSLRVGSNTGVLQQVESHWPFLFHFSVFGEQSGSSNGEKMSLCCISTELILLAWLSFKAHETISKNKVTIKKRCKKVTTWFPSAHLEASVQYQPHCRFVGTKIPQFHPQTL